MKIPQYISSMLLLIAVYLSCQPAKDRDPYFKGTVQQVRDIPRTDTLLGEKIVVDEPFAGFPFVYDSLIFFAHPRFRDFNYYCINLNNGEMHARYFRPGKGPNEFIYVTPIFQVDKNDQGDAVSPFVGINERKLGLFNIDRSISTKNTEIDTAFSERLSENYPTPFTLVFTLGKGSFLAKQDPAKLFLDEERYSPPKYLLFSSNADIPDKEYEMYNEFYNEHLNEGNEVVFASVDRISLKNKKVAMALVYVPQINILDLETGIVTGVRTAKMPDFSALSGYKGNDRLAVYTKYIDVDDDHIYVLYAEGGGGEEDDGYEHADSDTILIFDWDGQIVKQLKLRQRIENFSVDSKNGFLYGINTREESIFRFKL